MAQVLDTTELKRIWMDKKIVNLVNGFVRNAQELLPSNAIHYNIPELIVHIVLMFYHIKECWDETICGEHFVIDGDVIFNASQNQRYKTAFLTKIVSSGIHHWKFKV